MATSNTFLTGQSDAIAALIAAAGAGIVAVNGRHRVPSSGVHWREGLIVASEHSLKRDDEITVVLPNGQETGATVAGRDPGTDLALLKIEPAGLPLPQFGATAGIKPGNLVFAAGRRGPNGISASMGVVGAASGPWRTWRGGQVDQFIRPDVNLYPGMSGGPLLDAAGNVLGINTSALSRGSAITIPVATVNRVCDELLKRGKIARGYLGVGLHPVELPAHGGGVIVLSVEPGGPAATASIFVGDVIIGIGGQPVRNTDDVQLHLGSDSIGKPLALSVVRGGGEVEVQVIPGER